MRARTGAVVQHGLVRLRRRVVEERRGRGAAAAERSDADKRASSARKASAIVAGAEPGGAPHWTSHAAAGVRM